MRILFYSDVHLRDNGSFFPYNMIEKNGLSKELNNILLGFDFIRDQILVHHPNLVVFCGDLYHYPEVVSTQCLHASSIALSKIKYACEKVNAKHYLIPGQHDIIDENNYVTSISNLVGYGDILLRPIVIDDVFFSPYCSNAGKLYTTLIEAQQTSSLVIAHADFNGGLYDNLHKSESRISPILSIPCISGDLHIPHDVESVHYVGSLVQNRFQHPDLKFIGGILIFDTETQGITRIRNTYSKHYCKISPKFATDEDYIKRALELDPEKVVLAVYSKLAKEEIEGIFKDYEMMYYPMPQDIFSKNEEQQEINQALLETPEVLLRDYVSKERPSAVSILNGVLGQCLH